ncbi:cyclase family protein [Cladochytrium replicatum]|nr:cyclase family protein [Cladochytrium replicatum]
MNILRFLAFVSLIQLQAVSAAPADWLNGNNGTPVFWRLFNAYLRSAKYVDLTHTLKPRTPVWKGFRNPAEFKRAINISSAEGAPYSWESDGFEAAAYVLNTDQFGTQLDPPAHWSPYYAGIDELPATFAIRPLVVINFVDKVKKDFGYQLTVQDIKDWEKKHNLEIPAGSVVFLRSDWSKQWDIVDPIELAAQFPFPGLTLDAAKFLHLERKILFHGHEPLDTDTTPTLETEAWILTSGYTQAEGVANLDKVPETGCLLNIGFPKFAGGTGGYARFVAICPAASSAEGITIADTPDSPLPKQDKKLVYDQTLGYRVRA